VTSSGLRSAEGDEVLGVRLVVVEDHEHVGLPLVVHHAVEAVVGVGGSGGRCDHGGLAQRVAARQDQSHVQPHGARRVRAAILRRVRGVDGEVNSLSVRGPCERETHEKRHEATLTFILFLSD